MEFDLPHPYPLFLGEETAERHAKTDLRLLDWAPELGATASGGALSPTWVLAPSYVLGQLCDMVDLDGPTFLIVDRSPSVEYVNRMIHCSEALWWGTPQ